MHSSTHRRTWALWRQHTTEPSNASLHRRRMRRSGLTMLSHGSFLHGDHWSPGNSSTHLESNLAAENSTAKTFQASRRSFRAGLIFIDQESNIVELVHYTAKEYFERNPPQWVQFAGAELARSCLQYLTFDVFACGPCRTDDEFERRTGEHVFLDYAARYWGEHCKDIEGKVIDLAYTFLSREGCTSSASQAMFVPVSQWGNSQNHPAWLGTHAIAFFGLDILFRLLLKKRPNQQFWLASANSKDEYGRTPLSWATENGNEEMVRILIDLGDKVDADSKDHYGRTPLSWAARNGYEAVARMLIDLGDKVDVNSEN